MKRFRQFTEELRQISGSRGSNPGGVYKDDEDDSEHYIKHPKNPDQAKSEVLSGRIHELMGIHTLKPKLINVHPNTTSVSTKFNHHLEPITSAHLSELNSEHHKQLGNIYSAGVLTKNWDAMGSNIDRGDGNVSLDKKHGHLVSTDQGGSFNFRAQGGHKHYGDDISEKDTLRDPTVSQGAKFFNKALEHPGVKEHVVDTLKNLDHKAVHTAFKESGLSNWEELHNNFKERHKKLLDNLSNS
jgi:hypothetical protein